MKLNRILMAIVILSVVLAVLILWFSVFREPRSTELENLTFEELCKTNNDMWMEMEPAIKGEKLSNEMCFGCMIADSHFCSADEYTDYVKNLPSFVR